MAIVLEEPADRKRKYEKAHSRIAQLENVLWHSPKLHHPGYDMRKAAAATKAALPARLLSDHSGHEEPPPKI